MIARYSRVKLVLTVGGGLAFVVLGVWLLIDPAFGPKAQLAGAASIVFFGLCSAFATWSLLDKRPVLVIDTSGIFDRRSMDRTVPWSEIGGISEIQIRNKTFYYLDVGAPVDRFTTSPLKRWLLNMNQGFCEGVVVSPHTLDVSQELTRNALLTNRP